MAYEAERKEGRRCVNYACGFYDDTGTFEQGCSAGDSDGNAYVPECESYIPEHDGA